MLTPLAEIRCLRDGADILHGFAAELLAKTDSAFCRPMKAGGTPSHLWFRGEPDCPGSQLTPTLFRTAPDRQPYNESGLISFVATQRPELTGSSLFDTLSRYQHHRYPTRLLDWSESFGVALFFAATSSPKDGDAWLFCLNARLLNRLTGNVKSWTNIHEANDFGTRFRCEFAQCGTSRDWFRRVAAYTEFDWARVARYQDASAAYPGTDIPFAALADHCTPIAVRPLLNHPRAIQQRSVFTLHGGRLYPENDDEPVAAVDRIPAPASILELAAGTAPSNAFLRPYRIPATSKADILWELKVLGFREGLLFPDTDAAAEEAKEIFS